MVTGEDFGDRLDRLNDMIEGLSRQVTQLSTSGDTAAEPIGATSDSSSSVADEN